MKAVMKGMELPFRITVVDPPPGVIFRLQSGRFDLVPPAEVTANALVFDFTLRVQPGGAGEPPNFLGPFAQGPRAGRFVYVNSGQLAGQAASPWTRRAKIHLRGIEAALIEQAAKTGGVIETSFAGTGRDGGPACATVPLLGGWRVAP